MGAKFLSKSAEDAGLKNSDIDWFTFIGKMAGNAEILSGRSQYGYG
jgi:hypothetical protein